MQESGHRQIIYAVRIAVNRWLFEAWPALSRPCQGKGMPSRAAEGDRKSGANGLCGTLCSKERLIGSLKATPRSGVQ